MTKRDAIHATGPRAPPAKGHAPKRARNPATVWFLLELVRGEMNDRSRNGRVAFASRHLSPAVRVIGGGLRLRLKQKEGTDTLFCPTGGR